MNRYLLGILGVVSLAACGGHAVTDDSHGDGRSGLDKGNGEQIDQTSKAGNPGTATNGSAGFAGGTLIQGGSGGQGGADGPGGAGQRGGEGPLGGTQFGFGGNPGCFNDQTTGDANPGVAGAGGGAGIYPAGTAPNPCCNFFGDWTTHGMESWNGLSTESPISFHSEGWFSGPDFKGNFWFDGTNLVVTDSVGTDMTCAQTAQWTVAYTSDCSVAALVPRGDNCTGARRFLDWNVTLTRAPNP